MAKTMEFDSGSGPDIFFRVIFSIVFSLLAVFLFLVDRAYRKEKIIKTRKYVNKHPFKILLIIVVLGFIYYLYYIFFA